MKFAFALSVAALLGLAACSKSDSTPSREETLRGRWIQTAGTVTSFYAPLDRDSTTDYWKNAPKCYTDNSITFGNGYTGEVSYGKEQCSSAQPQSETLFWQVSKNDTILEVNNASGYFYGADPMRGAIQELTSSSLKIRYTIDSPAAGLQRKVYTYVNTYSKQ